MIDLNLHVITSDGTDLTALPIFEFLYWKGSDRVAWEREMHRRVMADMPTIERNLQKLIDRVKAAQLSGQAIEGVE